MINQSTIDTLKVMRMTAMANELQRQLDDPSTYNTMGFEDRLGFLVDAEWNRRQANKLSKYIKNAHFSNSGATIEGIEYFDDRKLDKAQILRFSTCRFIDEGHHIILKGASGSGKTYIACAIGNAACRKFKTVKYIRMPELLDELKVARGCGTFKKVIHGYQKVNLLILDEWLIRPLETSETYDLLEIVEARCASGSTIFCTQYDPKEWYERIYPEQSSQSPISEAIMDRIVYNSYEVLISGRISMRERHGLKALGKAVPYDEK